MRPAALLQGYFGLRRGRVLLSLPLGGSTRLAGPAPLLVPRNVPGVAGGAAATRRQCTGLELRGMGSGGSGGAPQDTSVVLKEEPGTHPPFVALPTAIWPLQEFSASAINFQCSALVLPAKGLSGGGVGVLMLSLH